LSSSKVHLNPLAAAIDLSEATEILVASSSSLMVLAGALDIGEAVLAGALDKGEAVLAGALDIGEAVLAGTLDIGDAVFAGALNFEVSLAECLFL